MNDEAIDLSWDDFINEVVNKPREEKIYYRGERDISWALETTLSRSISKKTDLYPADSYHKEIISLCGKESIIEIPFKSNFMFADVKRNEAHEIFALMIELRHCGKPSPLLDWTEDHAVAAFFASNNKNKCESAFSIWTLEKSTVAEIKSVNSCDQRLYVLDRDTELNEVLKKLSGLQLKRHEAQKSTYTIAFSNSKKDLSSMDYRLGCCKNFSYDNWGHPIKIRQYIFSSTERSKIFKDLLRKNINAKSMMLENQNIYDDLTLEI